MNFINAFMGGPPSRGGG